MLAQKDEKSISHPNVHEWSRQLECTHTVCRVGAWRNALLHSVIQGPWLMEASLSLLQGLLYVSTFSWQIGKEREDECGRLWARQKVMHIPLTKT